jgi:PQQ-dependent catabolism-associated CXXCW motif protein
MTLHCQIPTRIAPFRLLLTLVLLAWTLHAHAANPREPRIALVIGNSVYKLDPLRNPAQDANDMSQALQAKGFRVTLRKDATRRQMIEAITEFGRELKKGGVGLFYFAGHGVQSKGRNYLIPVNAKVEAEGELEFETVDANRVLAAMDDAGNRVNIMILDACRNNPYVRAFRSAARGLAQMEATKGTYIAFATAPGSVASDGTGKNGLYTEHLLQSLKDSDTDIHRVFTRVTAAVSRVTGGKQVPWTASSLTGDFAFGASAADERALWETVKDTRDPAELNAFLKKFPNGLYSSVARARLKNLTTPSVQIATTAPAGVAAMVYANEDKDFGVAAPNAPRRGNYHASTPSSIPGAKLIRTVDLRQLLDQDKSAIVIDVLDSKDRSTIPGATWMPGAGSGEFFSAEKARFAAALEQLTAGDKGRTLVFLCLNPQCWLSYNASLHALEAGYKNVHWFRGGTDAWRGAGYPSRTVKPANW